MRSNSDTDRNKSAQYKVNGFYFHGKFFKKSDKFPKYAVRICVKDATPLLEPGKIWLYKVVTIYRHLYGGGEGSLCPPAYKRL